MNQTHESRFPFHDRWYAQVPAVHAWLNGDRGQTFAMTYPVQTFHVDFWFAPYYLMKALLGWHDCAAGAANLLSASVESMEGPVEMLRKVWGEQVVGTLGYWAWKNVETYDDHRFPALFEEMGLHERFAAAAEAHGFLGGSDPKHLDPHLNECIYPYQSDYRQGPRNEPLREGVHVVTEKERHRVAIIVQRFEDWPVSLGQVAGDRRRRPPSWHVHVTAADTGYIGRFRRCHDCGWWFQGPARFHKWGHR